MKKRNIEMSTPKRHHSSRRFDSVPRLSFIISKLRGVCALCVPYLPGIQVVFFSGFLAGFVAACALINLLTLQQTGLAAALLGGVLLVALLASARPNRRAER